jgi:hypothetical protein
MISLVQACSKKAHDLRTAARAAKKPHRRVFVFLRPGLASQGGYMRHRSAFTLAASVFAAALFGWPSTSEAQVTIKGVTVTVTQGADSTTYCDTTQPCTFKVWNLGGGVNLAVGQTLILSQTALLPSHSGFAGFNFDTSDGTGTTNCKSPAACTITISIDSGSGLAPIPGIPANNALNAFNLDPGGIVFNEASDWNTVFTTTNYSLALGYADNVHSQGCVNPHDNGNCFPDPFTGTVNLRQGGGPNNICTTNCYDAGALLITALALPTPQPGRMTGGGSVFTTDGIRVTHGFELHCNPADVPNNLEINWDGGNNFHLTSLTSAMCVDDPAIAPNPPQAGFDTFIGTGVGTCNGLPANISFVLTDAGEPGTLDTATYTITGGCSLTVSGNLTKGNQQAHNQ